MRDPKNRLYKIGKASYVNLTLINEEKRQHEIGRKTRKHIPFEEATPQGTSRTTP